MAPVSAVRIRKESQRRREKTEIQEMLSNNSPSPALIINGLLGFFYYTPLRRARFQFC